jgi:uncharacterized protein (DUF305 family)
MNTKQFLVILVSVIFGALLGYVYAGAGQYKTIPSKSSHIMPDGSVMHNGDATMSMEDMMKSMNHELKGKSGLEFDKAFLKEMIVHHEGAVDMAKQALNNSEHVEIKNMANAIISTQNKEIQDMKSWLALWFGDNK